MSYKITIILPYYNAENFLVDTFESYIKQSINFDEIQIIAINNASKDNGLNIVLEYEKKYKNIKSINVFENKSFSKIYNENMYLIEGSFVCFAKIGIFWKETAFESMYNVFKNSVSDLNMVAGYDQFLKKTNVAFFNKDLYIESLEDENHLSLRKCFFKSEEIKSYSFDENLHFNEDILFLNNFLLEKKTFVLCKGLICEERFNINYQNQYNRDDLKNYGKLNEMVRQTGDPRGGVEVNLAKDSLLYGIDPTLFRGVFNEREETIKSHSGETQLYTYSKSIYNADVYISIPKLKTHHKTGVTLNLKGQVGSIINKNQLVHWKVGYPEKNGDEYPSKVVYEDSLTKKVTNRGAWPGNDTIWRMVTDLYKGLLQKERKYFSVIDGIIAGEGQGPFCPHSVESKTLIAGDNFLLTDIIATRYMGIDPMKIKYLEYFIDYFKLNLEEIKVVNNNEAISLFFGNDKYLDFDVTETWKEIKIGI